MATLDELQQQLNALQHRVDAITAPPTDYYTQRYSGEETDRGVEIALGLDPDGTGIVTPEHGGTGADTTQAALAALGAGVRNNELDNPGLDVNQKGQLSYDTSKSFIHTLDRWWNIFGIYDVATRTFTSTNQTYGAGFRQAIENPSRFAGKRVTFTAWIAGGNGRVYMFKGTGINSGQVQIGSKVINGPGLYSVTVDVPDDVGGSNYPYLVFAIVGLVGEGSIQFASPIPFKLEFGEGQTLAYQDSDGNWQLLPQPDSSYGAQLLKCLRYQVFYAGSTTPAISQYSNDYLWAVMWLPVPLRTVPVLASGTIGVYGNGASLSTKIDGFAFEYFLKGNLLVIRAVKQSHGLTPVTATIQLNAPLFSANL